MLDKGFENDIRQIIGHCPTTNRQTLMCAWFCLSHQSTCL
jgi:superfamily II DNA/RNA helicase